MLKYCPSCYTEVEAEDKENTCPHCGGKLDKPFTQEEDDEMMELLMTMIQM